MPNSKRIQQFAVHTSYYFILVEEGNRIDTVNQKAGKLRTKLVKWPPKRIDIRRESTDSPISWGTCRWPWEFQASAALSPAGADVFRAVQPAPERTTCGHCLQDFLYSWSIHPVFWLSCRSESWSQLPWPWWFPDRKMIYRALQRILSEWCTIVAKTRVTVLHFSSIWPPCVTKLASNTKKARQAEVLRRYKILSCWPFLIHACRLQYTKDWSTTC